MDIDITRYESVLESFNNYMNATKVDIISEGYKVILLVKINNIDYFVDDVILKLLYILLNDDIKNIEVNIENSIMEAQSERFKKRYSEFNNTCNNLAKYYNSSINILIN